MDLHSDGVVRPTLHYLAEFSPDDRDLLAKLPRLVDNPTTREAAEHLINVITSSMTKGHYAHQRFSDVAVGAEAVHHIHVAGWSSTRVPEMS